jgi:hypothetical protein
MIYAIKRCTGVFHVAAPMDFESKDPEVNCCDPILVHRIDCNINETELRTVVICKSCWFLIIL